MRPDALCGLLAEPQRLAVFAAVVLGARTPGEVAERTGLPGRDVVVALRRLEQGGLVVAAHDGLVAHVTAFKEAVREYGVPAAAEEPAEGDPSRAAVLRAFVRDGRIVQMPAARGKRRVLLEHIVAIFEPGVRYPERQVDAILRAWHDDYATLRRYLIDEGLMGRDAGVYWRTGGYVEV
ncbi:MAG TPA: DUF2087 domain-containing protein [Pilimelia sp.]|nr:DUF2087 domain-containing protein [Pilimelia sp.]